MTEQVCSTVHFVSGHLDLSDREFTSFYVPKIDAAIEAGDDFVVGDARGADTKAQEYLKGKDLKPNVLVRSGRVRVFHMLESPRFNAGFDTVGGFKSDSDRDAAMTLASYQDIYWIRPGRESSGTAKNLSRRESIAREGWSGSVVDVEIIDKDGTVKKTAHGPWLRRIHSNMAFLYAHEAAYCLGEDECGGYWNCNVESCYRLSAKSLARCRELRGIYRKGDES